MTLAALILTTLTWATLITSGIAHGGSNERFQVYTAHFDNYARQREGSPGLRPRLSGQQMSTIVVPPNEGRVGMYPTLVPGPVLAIELKGEMRSGLRPATYDFDVLMTLKGNSPAVPMTLGAKFQHTLTMQYFKMNPTVTIYWPIGWNGLSQYADAAGSLAVDFYVAIRNPYDQASPMPRLGQPWPAVGADGRKAPETDDNHAHAHADGTVHGQDHASGTGHGHSHTGNNAHDQNHVHAHADGTSHRHGHDHASGTGHGHDHTGNNAHDQNHAHTHADGTSHRHSHDHTSGTGHDHGHAVVNSNNNHNTWTSHGHP